MKFLKEVSSIYVGAGQTCVCVPKWLISKVQSHVILCISHFFVIQNVDNSTIGFLWYYVVAVMIVLLKYLTKAWKCSHVHNGVFCCYKLDCIEHVVEFCLTQLQACCTAHRALNIIVFKMYGTRWNITTVKYYTG